jgi:hypothetical protein
MPAPPPMHARPKKDCKKERSSVTFTHFLLFAAAAVRTAVKIKRHLATVAYLSRPSQRRTENSITRQERTRELAQAYCCCYLFSSYPTAEYIAPPPSCSSLSNNRVVVQLVESECLASGGGDSGRVGSTFCKEIPKSPKLSLPGGRTCMIGRQPLFVVVVFCCVSFLFPSFLSSFLPSFLPPQKHWVFLLPNLLDPDAAAAAGAYR